MALDLLKYRDAAALAEEAASMWLSKLDGRDTVSSYTVALSGGRIARNFFEDMAWRVKNLPGPSAPNELFGNVHFFWADQRCVPPTDPESNYGIARELLFEPLKVPESQIHRLRGEENEALALRDAVENIQKWARSDKGQPALDLIFLGMGED